MKYFLQRQDRFNRIFIINNITELLMMSLPWKKNYKVLTIDNFISGEKSDNNDVFVDGIARE